MGSTVAKQHTVGNNRGAATTHLQHTDEKAHKQQLGFLCLGDCKQRFAHCLIVEASCEGWVGKTQGVAVLVGVVGREAVTILNVGIVNSVQHQVHSTDAEHGEIGVEDQIKQHKFFYDFLETY